MSQLIYLGTYGKLAGLKKAVVAVRRQSARRLWTPADATSGILMARWKATSGLTLIDGLVDRWDSSVGTLYAYAESAVRRPQYNAASFINGKPEVRALRGRSNDQRQRLRISDPSLFPQGNDPFTYMVTAFNGDETGGAENDNTPFGWGADSSQILFKSDRIIAKLRDSDLHSEMDTTKRWRTGLARYMGGASVSNNWQSLAPPQSMKYGTTTANNDPGQPSWLFGRPAFGDRWHTGGIREVSVLRGALSDADMQRMLGYAAWDNETVGDLPSTSPYLIGAPTVIVPDNTNAWTPDDLAVAPVGWFDFGERGSLNLKAGRVQSVVNKGSAGGFGTLVSNQPTGPTYSVISGVNGGKPVVSWPGGAGPIQLAMLTKVSTGAMSILGVAAPSVDTNNIDTQFISGTFGGTGTRFDLFFGYGQGQLGYNVNGSDKYVGPSYTRPNPIVFGYLFNGGTNTPYGNGVVGNTSSYTVSTLPQIGLGTYAGGTSNPLSGFLGEYLVFDYVLSDRDRQYLEGYLAWRWNLQMYLPTNHMFAGAPPTR